ncbi:MAG: hypothetical protein JO368_07555 [Acidimicrobiales bacterium]|nr:hypothetical protein [Acidimicrobiales bacterium]
MLRAGRELLWEEGLAVGAEHVTFSRVFARLEATEGVRVTHASVIKRIWRNQEAYQTAVVARLAAADQWNVGKQLDAQLVWAIDSIEPDAEASDEARWRAAIKVVRTGGAATFDSVVRSRVWPRFAGIWALAMADSDCERMAPIVAALTEGERRDARRFEGTYAAALDILGLRVRFPFTLHQFSVLLGAYTEGSAIRDRVDSTMSQPIERPTGPAGEAEAWTPFTVGLEALTRAFLEVDPDWTPPDPAHDRGAPCRPAASEVGSPTTLEECTDDVPAGAAPRAGPTVGPAAPSRRRREELRELLLSTGVDLLVEDGLASGAAHLGFRRVFDRVEAATGTRPHNAAVIGRIWPNQAAFQQDVLLSVVAEATEIMAGTADELPPALVTFDRSTVEARWRSLGQLCRTGGALTVEALGASRRWQRWVGVWALVTAGSERSVDASTPVREALRQGFGVTATRYEGLLLLVVGHLGFRLRPGLTLRHLTTAATALIEGCVLRYQGRARSTGFVVRPTGPNGEDEEWTVFSVGLEALLRGFLEVDEGS